MKKSFIALSSVFVLVSFSGCSIPGCISNLKNDDGEHRQAIRPQQPQQGEQARAYLMPIARKLGLTPSSERSSADLAVDIKLALDEETVYAPAPLSDACMVELKKVLEDADYKALEKSQSFLRQAQGRRLLTLPQGVNR